MLATCGAHGLVGVVILAPPPNSSCSVQHWAALLLVTVPGTKVFMSVLLLVGDPLVACGAQIRVS